MAVEIDDRLAEGADPTVAWESIEAAGDDTLACTHGDVIPGIVRVLGLRGLEIVGPRRCEKASIWTVQLVEDGSGRPTGTMTYRPPPEAAQPPG